MTDLTNLHKKPFIPQTTGFFDRFYLGSTLLSLSSITATKLLPNVKTLPFFTAFFVIGTAGASWYWKRKDIQQINEVTQSVHNLTEEKTPSKHANNTSQPNPFQQENEQLKKRVEEQSKEIEDLKKKLQAAQQQPATPNSKSTTYSGFQANRPKKEEKK